VRPRAAKASRHFPFWAVKAVLETRATTAASEPFRPLNKTTTTRHTQQVVHAHRNGSRSFHQQPQTTQTHSRCTEITGGLISEHPCSDFRPARIASAYRLYFIPYSAYHLLFYPLVFGTVVNDTYRLDIIIVPPPPTTLTSRAQHGLDCHSCRPIHYFRVRENIVLQWCLPRPP
jgi:hypothetical protein